ncbi:ATP-dependent zinc metalloprotease FtsH [Clostridium facile]|uniref:ATP-dependent zinc metalloprotease FtsH n=1 Tax=Clostridium facile TaxID=2763035 RepID=UPI0025704854|nr:ATP-dependent zinc metalloprotease FtsH [Clostridium facile]
MDNQNKNSKSFIVPVIIILVLAGVAIYMLMNMKGPSSNLKYYEVVSLFQNNQVKAGELDLGSGELKLELRDGVDMSKFQSNTNDRSNNNILFGGNSQDNQNNNATSSAVSESSSQTSSTEESNTAESQASSEQASSSESSSSVAAANGNQNGNQSNNKNGQSSNQITYKVPSVNLFVNSIDPLILEYNKAHPDDMIEMNYTPASDNSWLLQMIPTALSLLLIVGLLFFMMKQANAGAGKIGQFGKANLKNSMERGRTTTFDEVAGAEEEKEELSEIVEFLKNPKKFNELGARVPKGVLLVGPPGTGKTLLARAVAGEAGVPFFSISGSDFVEMYVGVGASRVRDLFEQAKKNAPAIIFIDEIDAVGRQRGAGLGGGHDEREQTLNQLLVEMDGFGANEGVIIIAATNRRDILDPALLRSGRFDRQVVVGYPDVKGREEILKVHSRNKILGFDVDLSVIAKSTAGFTGADLESLMNEAALLAARKNHKAITASDIEEATIKVIAGPEKKSRIINEKEKRLTAYHEAGHAVATYYSPTQDPVHQISIIPRGMAGGYTMSLPEHDRSYVLKQNMQEELVVLLGGRIAESIVLDDISTGASNDIERATDIARNMVTRYGFSEKLGPIVYGESDHEVFLGRDFNNSRNYSETVATEIDEEIRSIMDRAYKTCHDILVTHRDQLEIVAQYLIRKEKVDADTFVKLMTGEITLEDIHKMDEQEAQEKARKEAQAEQNPSSTTEK